MHLESLTSPSEKSRLSYCAMVMIFLEAIDKEVQALQINDIYSFMKQSTASDSRINDTLPQVAKFISFCKEEGISTSINEQDILNLRTPRNKVKEKNPSRVITPNDIVRIRKSLIARSDIRKLLTFELLYGFGLKEQDLNSFTFDNYNIDDGAFRYNGKTYLLPEYLRTIILQTPERIRERYSTYGGKETEAYKNHIAVSGDLIGIKLKILDLIKTHKETSIKCPNPECENTHPFEDQYWMLQEEVCTESLSFYFPLCNFCARKIKEGKSADE